MVTIGDTGGAVELDGVGAQPRMHRWGQNCHQQTDERHAQVKDCQESVFIQSKKF